MKMFGLGFGWQRIDEDRLDIYVLLLIGILHIQLRKKIRQPS